MKQIAHYSESEVEYDDENPCIICGEPVTSASMGGTAICPWCDMGKCRYCSVRMMVLRKEIDGGRSMKEWRKHMEWHKVRDPDFNKRLLEIHRHMNAELRKGK